MMMKDIELYLYIVHLSKPNINSYFAVIFVWNINGGQD